jgi:hypothetical protein
MKTYTTLDAIGDMFVIYGIVIVVSMLVAWSFAASSGCCRAGGSGRSQGAGQTRTVTVAQPAILRRSAGASGRDRRAWPP